MAADESATGGCVQTKTQAQWCEIMEGTDVCFAPVLSFVDAPAHPANVARQTYIEVDGVTQPAPAPRFSRTPSMVRNAGSGPARIPIRCWPPWALVCARSRNWGTGRDSVTDMVRGLGMSEYETVLVERSDGVAVVSLNRPGQLNAFNAQLRRDLRLAVRR